jgi:hypothetical protein
MPTASFRHAGAALLTVILSTFALAALAAVPVHVVKTDLKPLIRAGLDSPVQFAVFVPHAVSTSSGGTWSTANGRATWRYAVEIPTAVLLSFHASKSALPASAQLLVRGTRTTASIRWCAMLRNGFMGRYQYRRVKIAGSAERYHDEPEKNEYSHPHDALQYVATKIFGDVVRGLEGRRSRPLHELYPEHFKNLKRYV